MCSSVGRAPSTPCAERAPRLINERSLLFGKTAVVTGATDGLGLAASVRLAQLGASLVLVGRNRAKGDAALAAVKARSGSDAVTLLVCDFASVRQVRALAAEIRARCSKLHILVNNAGSVNARRELTEDGVERTFAVNHLAPFLLTNLLLDVITRSAPARIVVVASEAHRQGDLPFDDLNFARGGYAIMRAYARSKLANVLFSAELAQRLSGSGVTANALHPGAVATNIWSHAPGWTKPFLGVAKLFMKSPEEAADTIVYLAASPDVEGHSGGYYRNNRATKPSRRAQDAAVAAQLWAVSAQLTGLPDSRT